MRRVGSSSCISADSTTVWFRCHTEPSMCHVCFDDCRLLVYSNVEERAVEVELVAHMLNEVLKIDVVLLNRR